MKIHEYQAKEILRQFQVPVPQGQVASTAEEAEWVARELGTDTVVIKAQIHAGGRGKGGGVKIAKTPRQAREIANAMLGMTLVTPQTGPEGKEVLKLLVEEGLPIEKELYVGVTIDRSAARPVVMASAEGGMEIEEVAARFPEKILKVFVDCSGNLKPFQARQLAYGLGLQGRVAVRCARLFLNLYDAFSTCDASLAEINPLVITRDERVAALDAKFVFDDNALFRQQEYLELRDLSEERPLEIEAGMHNLNYIKLDGEVGCMVNGAGLAMATMDLVKLSGSMPANFLDVGGAANVDRVAAAFRILMSDKNVKAVLVNIFGGIVRCDRVARGIVQAMSQVEVNVPVVVRLQGTNALEGREILKQADFPFIVVEGLGEITQRVAEALRGAAVN
ncbi:MAG TPA: ADP-forming succinate--CoA ligase subunit beta [bacterium]|nr:ADP-forming succinate--CoA ligase subunit beta [Candidatus Omnitrophota bacterium]HOJ59692.1 ADP-forming succinate--CoA ligase subunit beta [bacterium]HOL93169.1 ADP-forming succinate--CoA ligase subunit beta [bacterium]HPP00216.1 ADP-forming succinate--CoA ligase subunit beta [bacterium]